MKISIIIPVYNAEKYLSKCIDSILANTYTNYELILIDDKSCDSSATICQQYTLRDKRIRFYTNKINSGVAATRNKGIELAKGEYIMFCDNDDIVSPLWIEHLLEWVEKDKRILPICSICCQPSMFSRQKELSAVSSIIFNKHQYFLFNKIGIAGYIWNTIFNRKIINENQIRFNSRKNLGDINEDLIFSINYLNYIDHIVYTGYTDYCHIQNDTNHSTVTDDKFYYDKYKEKYYLWKTFISSFEYENKESDFKILANQTLFYFIQALKTSSLKGKKKIHLYKKIICSKEISDVLQYADLTKENKKLIYLIKKKHYLLIWILFCITK